MATYAELDAWVTAIPVSAAFQISKPIVASESGETANGVQNALAQMRELRHQMRELGADIRSSLQALTRQVQTMKVELQKHNCREMELFCRHINDGLGTQDLLRLVCSPSHMKEAS